MDAYARHVMDASAQQAVEIASTTLCYECCNTTNFTRNALEGVAGRAFAQPQPSVQTSRRNANFLHKLIFSLLTWVYSSAVYQEFLEGAAGSAYSNLQPSVKNLE